MSRRFTACACWGWAVADAAATEELVEYGHRADCEFFDGPGVDLEWELDPGLMAEIQASWDEDDDDSNGGA